jgi:hypothetical protein
LIFISVTFGYFKNNNYLDTGTEAASGLQFGPIHAALATLVYGKLTSYEDSLTGGDDLLGMYARADPDWDEEEEETSKEHHTPADELSLTTTRSRMSQVYRGLLASSRGIDQVAVDFLSPHLYELRSILGGESVHHDALVRSMPIHLLNSGQHVAARAMLSERTFHRPGSPVIWDEYSRALAMSGETMAARMADDHASNLGFGQGGFGAH